MPGGLPAGREVCSATDLVSAGVAVPSGIPGNNLGAWVPIVSSLAEDCDMVEVTLIAGSSDVNAFDIGVGGSGSEVVIVHNLATNEGSQIAGANTGPTVYRFPLSIPAGSRVSARTQDAFGNTTSTIYLTVYEGAATEMEGAAGVDSIGFSAATSLGTTVVAGNGSKGSYANLTALVNGTTNGGGVTTRDYMGLMVLIDTQNNFPAHFNSIVFVDIAIGTTVILPNIKYAMQGRLECDGSFFYEVPIPAGSQIQARIQDSNGDTFGVTVYGVYQ